MRLKPLGRTGENVPAVGQGMGVGGFRAREAQYRDKEYVAALQRGIDLGMTLIDTAEEYGAGRAEEVLAEVLAGRRDRVFVATKFSPQHNSRSGVVSACDASLRRLRTDRIDLYQMHWPSPSVPLEETMAALASLAKAGKVRNVGVSNCSVGELRRCKAALGGTGLVSVQVEYNLFDRSIEARVLPYCIAEGVTVIAYSPLDQGRIANGAARRGVLAAVAGRHGCSPVQVALAWVARHERVVAVSNATRGAHVAENAVAGNIELTPLDLGEIDRAFSVRPVELPADRIRVASGPDAGKVYLTRAEAVENRYNLSPSPMDLSKAILAEQDIKPVRVARIADPDGKWDYELLEGRVRYWAWVLAFDGKRPIPACVREN